MYSEKIFVRDLPSEMQQENRMGIGNFVNFFLQSSPFCNVCVSRLIHGFEVLANHVNLFNMYLF